jgi:hypothetical protein
MTELGILDLLGLRGISDVSRVKMVRHADERFDLHQLIRDGWFELYQRVQGKPRFDGVELVISFLGVEGTKARLHGIYRVGQRSEPSALVRDPVCPCPELYDAPYHYGMTLLSEFEDFYGRVVIEWGQSTRSWAVWAQNKPIYQILPAGRVLEPFTDYLDFTLSFGELEQLVKHQYANPEWRSRLAAVAGVYLILATTSGAQYVGSASGVGGLWSRWQDYVISGGHGNNAQLKELIASDSAYPAAFRFSVLQILPRTYSRDRVLALERTYKLKLGSRAIGLNSN